jgi:RNA polymerase sigma factor (sigma-70 family)
MNTIPGKPRPFSRAEKLASTPPRYDTTEVTIPMTTTTNNDTCTVTTSNIEDLLPRVADGDPKAWEEIMHRYNALVSATVRSFRLQEADTLDAIQTTWLRLAQNVHRIQYPDRLGGWLATTARRECLHILRRIRRTHALSQTIHETLTDPSAGLEQRVIDSDMIRLLWKYVDELPLRQRTVLQALFTDNPPPYTRISAVTGIPAGGIGPTRTRALQQCAKGSANTNHKGILAQPPLIH